MKTVIGALFGAGALGLVFIAYLALTGRQEVRQEINVDKARFEQEAAKFDQRFDEKWQAFDGKQPTKSAAGRERGAHEARADGVGSGPQPLCTRWDDGHLFIGLFDPAPVPLSNGARLSGVGLVRCVIP